MALSRSNFLERSPWHYAIVCCSGRATVSKLRLKAATRRVLKLHPCSLKQRFSPTYLRAWPHFVSFRSCETKTALSRYLKQNSVIDTECCVVYFNSVPDSSLTQALIYVTHSHLIANKPYLRKTFQSYYLIEISNQF